MKLFMVILMVICVNASFAESHSTSIAKAIVTDTTTLKAKKLKQYYMLCHGSTGLNEMYEQKFFDEFPDTFIELNKIYGYDDKTEKGGILYEESGKHIRELFNNLEIINDTLYYKKVIKLAIGGHWDADAVNFFQHGLRNKVENNPELTVLLLKDLDEKQVRSFWYFYFDGPHPEKQITSALQKIKTINIEIYNMMNEAHELVLSYKE